MNKAGCRQFSPELAQMLQRGDIRTARDGLAGVSKHVIATGFAQLDAVLPGGGWPTAALTEILLPQEGCGVMRLLLPALVRINQTDSWIAWIAPPHIPYAPALQNWGLCLAHNVWINPPDADADAMLWALEEILSANVFGAVLAWQNCDLSLPILRRLQLAAEHSQTWCVLLQYRRAPRQASPAVLRLRVTPAHCGIMVECLKRHGGQLAPLALRFDEPEFEFADNTINA